MAAADHGELEGSYSLEEEIELLEAIYIHELTVEGPRESPSAVSVLLHPSTGDEEHKRFVCLTLLIHLPPKYPSELPAIHIKTPRGLSEAHIESILSNLRELAESCLGRPMLYELIEYAKESLTDNNMPSCACAICLFHFQDSEFTKTECYHYFHCGCLARYIEFSLEQDYRTKDNSEVECPMCRLPITYNLTELKTVASSEVTEEEIVYKPSEEVRTLQKKMASLLKKQKKKGGVIDIEQERNRFLIDITSVRQEESLPESEPLSGPDTDTVKTNPLTKPSTNNTPKLPDVAKGNNEPNEPERKEQKEFPKNSRTSRGPRRPFDGSVNRSGEEKTKQHEQRKTENKRPIADDRPRSAEQKDREKVAVEKSKEKGSDCAPSVDTLKTNPVAEPSTNNAPKRPDVAKGSNEPNDPIRNDKLERREKKEFPKNSRTSRGPRGRVDASGNRSGEERVKQYEQRRTEKKGTVDGRPRSTEQKGRDDRPKSTEQKDGEKVGVTKSKEEGSDCAPSVDTLKTNPVTEPSTNNAPKRPDVGKGSNEPNEPERKEQKEFPKNSRTSRGPRRPVDASGNRSGEEGVKQHEQRRTEKKGTVNSRPRSTEQKGRDDRSKSTEQKDGEKVGVKKSKGEWNDCPSCTDVKPEQTELEPDKKSFALDISKKAAKDISSRSNNSISTQTSNSERPKSVKRGRGRSGRGRTSGGSKSEFQDGGKDFNKNTTFSGEDVEQTGKTRPLGSVKPSVEENAFTQVQATDFKENPSHKGTNTINKGKARKPPPGFENVIVDKRGCEQSTNDSRPPPPGFEKCSSRPRPPPGFDMPVDGAG